MSTEDASAGPSQNFLVLLWDMIRRPRWAFENRGIRKNRGWILMAIMTMVAIVLPIIAAAPITTQQAREAFQASLESQRESGQTISPEMEGQISQLATNPLFTVVFPSVVTLTLLWLGWLVWAGGLHLVGTMTGGESQFGEMWRTVVWSWLPFAVRGSLQFAFILLTGEVIAHPGLSGLVADQRPVSELITAPPSTGQLMLQSLLSKIDLFLVWNLALLILGVSITARLSNRKAIFITMGVWAVLVLLGLLPTLLSGFALSQSF
jgi:hypothetical protein